MSPLSNKNRQLIFDYCVGHISEELAGEAESLIASDNEAAELYSKFKAAFFPLESIKEEDCPDELVEGTIRLVNNSIGSGKERLKELLSAEQIKESQAPAPNPFWWRLGKVVAAAAVIILIAGIFTAPLKYARRKSWQQKCQSQLHKIWQGIDNYASEHNEPLPSVSSASGQPWWKIGYQGRENCSNTRNLWVLVKYGYVQPENFVCPGADTEGQVSFDGLKVERYNDFPSRRHISYSFTIIRKRPAKVEHQGRRVLLSDLNPLFEKLPDTQAESLNLKLSNALMHSNSLNHNQRGQNVMFSDGSVEFLKTRQAGTSQDDIFTLQDTRVYQGVEVPKCESDLFLAP